MEHYPLNISLSFKFEGKKYRIGINIYHPTKAGSTQNAFFHVLQSGDRQPIAGSSMPENTPLSDVMDRAIQLIKSYNERR